MPIHAPGDFFRRHTSQVERDSAVAFEAAARALTMQALRLPMPWVGLYASPWIAIADGPGRIREIRLLTGLAASTEAELFAMVQEAHVWAQRQHPGMLGPPGLLLVRRDGEPIPETLAALGASEQLNRAQQLGRTRLQ